MIILDMDMPKCCNECQFVMDSFGDCSITGEPIPNYKFWEHENPKPDWCPIIAEIPKDKPWIVITEDTIRYNEIVDVSEWDLPKWTEVIRSKKYD